MIYHQVLNSYHSKYNARIYQNLSFNPHFHGNYELIYCFDGKPQITANDITEVLSPGEMILIPPYTIHSLQIQNAKTWVGVFAPDYIAAYDSKHKYALYSKFRCSKQIDEFLKTHLLSLEIPDKYLQIACLYMACNECIANAKPYHTNQNFTFMYEVIDYISANIQQEFSMKDLADMMNYEYHYFSALFNKCFNMKFKSFVNMFRFEKACSLLLTESLNSTQIAEACGFGSVRNFNRVFKELSGCTPNEYRQL